MDTQLRRIRPYLLLVFILASCAGALILADRADAAQTPCAHDLRMPKPQPPPIPNPSDWPTPHFIPYIYFNSAPLGRQFGIGINSGGMPINLHPQYAHLSLLDSSGKAFGSANRLVFDPCIPIGLAGKHEMYAGLPDWWIGFRFDPRGLPADMYHIVVSLDAGFATTSEGKAVSIERLDGNQSIAVFVSPHPDRLPSLTPGQQFIALDPPITSLAAVVLTDRNGKAVASSSLEGRILTLQRLDATRMQFKAENIDTPLYSSRASDATSIYGLYPLVVDDTVRALRQKYVGRMVWGFGGLDVIGGGHSGTMSRSLPIVGIYRAYNYGRNLNIGRFPTSNVDLQSTFVALDPLVIRFGVSALTMLTPVMGPPLPRSTVAYAVLSDQWDFERLYSLVSMSQAHPEWSSALTAKIEQQTVELGMTKDMIAWMLGYPSVYGTQAQVQALDTWPYDAPAPFDSAVHFHNGIVVKYDPPRNLP